jgi:hypothetical protein
VAGEGDGEMTAEEARRLLSVGSDGEDQAGS